MISIVTEVVAPEYHEAPYPCHVPDDTGKVKIPNEMPLNRTSSRAGDDG